MTDRPKAALDQKSSSIHVSLQEPLCPSWPIHLDQHSGSTNGQPRASFGRRGKIMTSLGVLSHPVSDMGIERERERDCFLCAAVPF